MTWAPVTMRWPAQTTRWLDDLGAAQQLASGELAGTCPLYTSDAAHQEGRVDHGRAPRNKKKKKK
ncbi:hypothetical protein KZ940_28715, partial [Pseudomonas aeruginosa]|nr:hypothetical protein [Pseudomonas aeruginosa]